MGAWVHAIILVVQVVQLLVVQVVLWRVLVVLVAVEIHVVLDVAMGVQDGPWLVRIKR